MVARNKQRIRLTEETLHKVVKESVMKILSGTLNEGAWGYGGMDNDIALDYRDEFMDGVMKLLIKTTTKVRNGHVEQASDESWSQIGLIDFVLDFFKEKEMFFLVDKKILDIYDERLSHIEKDNEWQQSWEKPEEIQKSLKECRRKLDEYEELYKKENG